MAAIANDVQWGSSPKITFDFSYTKKREGSTQYYQITVSCDSLGGNSYFGYPIYVKISLDGTEKTSYTLKEASPSQWGSAIKNTTGWLAVSNKTSGTTALKIRVYSGLGSTRDTTYTYNLDIDPAASTISCTTANIESKPTITINRASSGFTHTISYHFGTLKGTIATKTTATSITNWTIPASFYAEIPNAKTGKGTLDCATYSGNTLLGTTHCELNVGTDREKCKPTVSGTVVDINPTTVALTGDANVLVRYLSTARCTISATGNKSVGSITEKKINGTAVSGNERDIQNVETGDFTFYAKDSREYDNSASVTKTLVRYVRLTNDAEAQRDDPTSGKATLTIKGNYFNGSFGAVGNAITVKYKLSNSNEEIYVTPTISGNTYSATVNLAGLDYTQAFTCDVTVSDGATTVLKTLTIPKGIPVFDWGENDFNFNVPVTIQGVNILEKLAELESRIS